VVEFFLGILAFRFFRNISPGWSFFISAAGLVLFISPFSSHAPRLVGYGIPSMLLIMGLTNLESSRKFWIPRPLLMAGDASYCLYLIHGPILHSILPDPSSTAPLNRVLILAAVAAVVALSIPIHLYIEKPLLRYLNEKTNFT
jgi:peptidoglycan/LPS O-acetylase OafA/YrhL